jgi:hypothetical protein
MKQFYPPLILCIATSLATSPIYAEGMCKPDEATIFNCELKKSVASFCRSSDRSIFTYRNGTSKQIDLEVTGVSTANGGVFFFSSVPYTGGGEAHIRFSREDYTYYLYDKTIQTNVGPTFSAGIVVYRGTKKIANSVCENDASIHQQAYEDMMKEEFQNIDSK